MVLKSRGTSSSANDCRKPGRKYEKSITLIVFYFGAIAIYAKKHKVDLAAAIEKANAEIPLITQFSNIFEAMLPASFKSIAISGTDMIVKGITFAEQLMDAGMLPADQRKASAMAMITAALKKANITPDEKTLGAISDAVDIAARMLLPHSTATQAVADATAYAGNVIGTVEDTGTAAAQDAQTGSDTAADIKAQTTTQPSQQ